MDLLLENAHKLLRTALDGPRGQEWTVFLDREGGLHLIAGADTPLEAVVHTRGAIAAWRVRRMAVTVRVEGFDGQDRCALEGTSANAAVYGLAGRGHYLVEPGAQSPAISARSSGAGNSRLPQAAWD